METGGRRGGEIEEGGGGDGGDGGGGGGGARAAGPRMRTARPDSVVVGEGTTELSHRAVGGGAECIPLHPAASHISPTSSPEGSCCGAGRS